MKGDTYAESLDRLMSATQWTVENARTLIDVYMEQGCSPGAAVTAILEEEQRAALALVGDEDSEEEDGYTPFSERDAAERVEAAEAALEHMSEEWLQNEFGTDQTDVIMDALNLYVEQHHKDVQHAFFPTGRRCITCGRYLPEELTPQGVDNTN